jgi:cation diffusion facilitator family transporter
MRGRMIFLPTVETKLGLLLTVPGAAVRHASDVTFRAASRSVVPPATESLRTVVVALLANLGVALAKLAAALLTGSTAMLAEAIHAGADTGNEVLLLVAQRRGERPPDEQHPAGHGREAYFWALIASLLLFLTGSLLSLRQGVEELLHQTPASSFPCAYVVLGLGFCLDGISLVRAYRQLRDEAAGLNREFLQHLVLSTDPIGRAVFAEDAAALAGNVIALFGVALHQATGSALPDGIAAIGVGLLLGFVALDLTRRNSAFLIGRQASSAVRRAVEAVIAGQPGVLAVTELLVTVIGPRRLWVVARIEIDDEITGARLKQLLGATERAVHSSPFIARVDLVPDTGSGKS